MKKIFSLGLIASAALAMTSCSTDEIGEAQSQHAIAFGTYVGNSVGSRGTITSTSSIQQANKGFGITAWHTSQSTWKNYVNSSDMEEPNFMYNQDVNYSGSEWSYAPVKYWPTIANAKITFFAYAPYGATGVKLSANTLAATPNVTFTVQEKPEEMVDFVADAVYDKTYDTSKTEESNKVKFLFTHELSRLRFKAKVTDALAQGTYVYITGLTMTGHYKSGTYSYVTDNDTQHGTWKIDDAKYSNIDLSGIMTKDANGNYAELSSNANADDLNGGNKNAQYLFLLPYEDFQKGDITVTVSYKIVTKDSQLDAGQTAAVASTKTVQLPAGILKIGKAYCVTLLFDQEVNKVVISADSDVDPWDGEDETTADIPSKE